VAFDARLAKKINQAMTPNALMALWLHRYRKSKYILTESSVALVTILRYWGLKISFLGRRKLIVVVRTEHFGDIVAAEPLARQLRQLHPNDHLVWLVRPVFKELITTHPDLNEAWPQRSVLHRMLVCKSGVFDKVYNLEFWQSNLDTVSGCIHKNQSARQQNITVFNYFDKGSLLTTFQLLANVPIQDATPRVYISEADRQRVDALCLPAKTIVVHCSSNYPVKDWSVDKWESLITWLISEQGYSVVEIGLKSQNKVTLAGYHNCCGQLSILQTAEVIRRANYFVGIDSGPAHLANAVGTFGVLLFGKLNNFDGYMPYSGGYQAGTNAVVVSEPSKTCAELDYELVKNKMAQLLKTTPVLSAI
jgi:heptosyltransferase III